MCQKTEKIYNRRVLRLSLLITISHVTQLYWLKLFNEREAMNYVSVAIIKPSANKARLGSLVAELRAFDCLVKVDKEKWLLEFQVPDTMLCWLRTGGLSNVFASYTDVVHWSKPFRETPKLETPKLETKALPVSREKRQEQTLRR
jgi:hypothetical protein